MKTKEEIKELLLDKFDSVYCDSCKGNYDDSCCYDCRRKYMYWSISDEYAEYLANKIINDDTRN